MFVPQLRILLIIGSLVTIIFMMLRIRGAKVQIRDSIYWIGFSFLLLVISIFPEITLWASRLLGIASPINFVYLFIIFILVIKLFSSSMRISQLDTRLQQLAQEVALNDKKWHDVHAGKEIPAAPSEEEHPSTKD